VRGETEKVGPPSDVYALGAILFEMIVGEVPFKAENPVELYHKIASSELVLPNTLKEGLPDEVVTIVAKAMEKEPQNRYATATELAEEIDRFLMGEPLRAKRPAKTKKRSKKGGGSSAFLLLGAVFVVAALVVVTAVAVWKMKPRGGDDAVRVLQEEGRAKLLDKRPDEARVAFEAALRLAPREPALEVDLARSLAHRDREKALAALERADVDGLSDASALDAFELKTLVDDARFKAVAEHAKNRR
jgi:hypothetical protein